MDTVTLSGGKFGGDAVELPAAEDVVERIDDEGGRWTYSRAGVDGRQQAVLTAYARH